MSSGKSPLLMEMIYMLKFAGIPQDLTPFSRFSFCGIVMRIFSSHQRGVDKTLQAAIVSDF